jgi:hypothetical protein
MQANVDFVEENNANIGVGVLNGAVGAVITPMVHDSVIASVFSVFGGLSNILIGVTSSSYNVHIIFTYRQKKVI